jgi:hypothetical protein
MPHQLIVFALQARATLALVITPALSHEGNPAAQSADGGRACFSLLPQISNASATPSRALIRAHEKETKVPLTQSNLKSGYAMAGEFCREAAVLIFVFGNLDIWLKSFTGELDKLPVSRWGIVGHVSAIFGATIVFGATGVLFEKWRDK